MTEFISTWVLNGLQVLKNAKHQLFIEGYNRRSFYAQGRPASANWTKQLQNLAWIKNGAGEWCSPAQIKKEEAEKFLSRECVTLLSSKGIKFL